MKKIHRLTLILLSVVALYFLVLIFRGSIVLPQAFNLGPITVRYFGISLALAVACAYWLAIKRATLYNIPTKEAEDIILWVIVGGFIGARLYHVLSSLPYYLQHPDHIIMVWHGGLSVIGSLLAGLLTLYWKLGDKRKILLSYLDWLAPSMVLGQIIGRFADLFNYELFGYPTSLPWKMFIPDQFRPLQFANSAYFHPLFLYESLGNMLILLLLLKLSRSKQNQPGWLFFLNLLSYGILRFFLEFLRIDSLLLGQFRLNAAVSLMFVAVSLYWLVLQTKRQNKPRLDN